MENTPLISVIVPCYNQAQYLDECLQSVLDQTYQNWECIIVNDGSPDNTEEVAKAWTEKDSRFIYLYKENGGLSSARNAGIEMAKGEWIQFLDCDDVITNEKFHLSSLCFMNSDLVLSDFLLFRDGAEFPAFCKLNEAIFDLENIILGWDNGLNIPIHCALFLKSSINQLKFDVELKSKEDWDFWISYFKKPKAVNFIPQAMAKYRINGNTVGTNLKLIHFANMHIYNKNGPYIRELLFSKVNKALHDSKFLNQKLLNYNNKLTSSKFFFVYSKIRSFLNI